MLISKNLKRIIPLSNWPDWLIHYIVSVFFCFGATTNTSGYSQIQTGNANLYAQQNQVLTAQRDMLKHVEITIEAPVVKLLPDDSKGIPHQRFLLQLVNGTTVLVAHDTGRAPRVPVKSGDWLRIKGEYIWSTKGGIIHWTHHSDNPWHPGGWIELNGQRYE